MAAIWKYDVKWKIRLRQSMRIYVKNIPAKFYPDPIWNDGALSLFEDGRPEKKKKKKKKSSDMRSVPDLKILPEGPERLNSGTECSMTASHSDTTGALSQ